MRTMVFAITWVVCVGLSVPVLYGQEARGTIQGRITDSSGAVVPGAKVEATNTATNVAVRTVSNADGTYALPYLLPGNHRLTASSAGFKTVQRGNIELQVGDRVQVDLMLEVGAITERVQVTAETPLLQTATSSFGMVVDSRRISDLPIAHGTPYALIFQSAGLVSTGPFTMAQQLPDVMGPFTSQINANGTPNGTTEFTMDGVPNTQTSNANNGVGAAISPPADLVQEFKLESGFDASSGHTSGIIVNLTLKTGGNTPHGTAYLFLRDPEWNANSFWANKAGQPRGDFTYKRWGATLTGPVTIPRLYRGRDRTFFSYGYEGLQMLTPNSYTCTVPTAKWAQGDFSDLLALSPQYQIYDPATTKSAGGGRFSRSPFPGNVIPDSRISPIAKKILTYFPQPNNPAAAPNGENNYTTQNRPQPETMYNHVGRVDHNFSDKQRTYVRLAFMHRDTGPYRDYWDGPATGLTQAADAPQIVLDDVYTLNPSTVLNVRYGYIRYAFLHKTRTLGFDPADLGFSPETTSLLTRTVKMFPAININGLENMGSEGADIYFNDVHSFFASVIKQRGNHNLKLGVDFRVYRNSIHEYGKAGGSFTFGPIFTRGPLDNSPTSPNGLGQGLAALLLGQPNSGYVDLKASQAAQSTYWAVYLHDNWRVKPRLTLDVGLRWEYEGPLTERYNRAVRGFDSMAFQPLEAAARAQYAAHPDAALSVDQFKVRGGYCSRALMACHGKCGSGDGASSHREWASLGRSPSKVSSGAASACFRWPTASRPSTGPSRLALASRPSWSPVLTAA